jgi:RNA polymerase sigma-32 factor
MKDQGGDADETDGEEAQKKDGDARPVPAAVVPRLPYLTEVRRYPLLSPEEEKVTAIAWHETGDKEAAQRLVTANLRLVIKIAFQYHRQWANVLDLIQEGNVGLVEALSRYDP